MINQTRLFELIWGKFKTKTESYKVVGEVLNLSPEAVRKIAYGKTDLSQRRFVKLVKKFEIPEEDWHLTGKRSLEINMLKYDENFLRHIGQYVRNEMLNIERLLNTKNATISVSTDEIPIFHIIRYPRLTCFKLYCFAFEEIRDHFTFEAFMRHVYNDELKENLRRIAQAYLAIPSEEIWHIDSLDSIKYEIPFMMDLSAFEKWDTALELAKDLKRLIGEVRQYAQDGEKSPNAKYGLFRRHFNDGSPLILAESKKGGYTYIKLDKLNYIGLSTDYFSVMKLNFKKIRHQSMSLDTGGMLENAKFFKQVGTTIKELQREIRKRKKSARPE